MPPHPRPQVFDTLIIGAGPAGLAAALAHARTRSTALVFDSKQYRNEGITHMHTVPSRDHFNPVDFRAISREQITSRYDSVWFEDVKIVTASQKELPSEKGKIDGFQLQDEHGTSYSGRKLILATGSRDMFPTNIPGYAENWPSHIYQCLACDGYEQRGSKAGVMVDFEKGGAKMAGHIVMMVRAFSEDVTVLTNGDIGNEKKESDEEVKQALKVIKSFGAKVDERKIEKLVNNGPTHEEGVTVHFSSGQPMTLGFIYHHPATENRAKDLIEQLGIDTLPVEQGGHVKVDAWQQTNVQGVFAAGDTSSMMKQVTIAMAEGLKAAVGAGMQGGGEKIAEILGRVDDVER